MTAEERTERMREIGRKGGKATASKYGNEYMRAIGKKGFQSTLTTCGFSDAGHLIDWLAKRGGITRRAIPRPKPALAVVSRESSFTPNPGMMAGVVRVAGRES
jgi:general stress protein YciG